MGIPARRYLYFCVLGISLVLSYQNCAGDEDGIPGRKNVRSEGGVTDPVVQVTSIPVEPGKDAIYEVTIEKALKVDLNFSFVTADDSALAGQHYIQTSSQGSIKAGSLSTVFIIKTKLTPLLDYNGKQFKINLVFQDYPGISLVAIGAFKPRPTYHYSSNSGSVAVGQAHTCAIKTGGALYCWGLNGSGQLGMGDTTQRTSPTVVPNFETGVEAVTAGSQHTCAIRAGALYCWGRGTAGALGNNGTANSSTPVLVGNMSVGVTSVSAGGDDTTCAIKNSALFCWGKNGSGQVGYNSSGAAVLAPYAVIGFDTGVSAVAVGTAHTCAIKNKALFCWGLNSSGQLGIGSTTTDAARLPATQTLAPVTGFDSNVAVISSNATTVCALKIGGALYCWGYNAQGNVGNATTAAASSPIAVNGFGADVTHVDASWDHTCAVKSGQAYCWGNNSNGELGYGNTTALTSPSANPVSVPFAVGEYFISVVAGGNAVNVQATHSCGYTNGGRVFCWGANANGQLGDATTVQKLSPVASTGFP